MSANDSVENYLISPRKIEQNLSKGTWLKSQAQINGPTKEEMYQIWPPPAPTKWKKVQNCCKIATISVHHGILMLCILFALSTYALSIRYRLDEFGSGICNATELMFVKPLRSCPIVQDRTWPTISFSPEGNDDLMRFGHQQVAICFLSYWLIDVHVDNTTAVAGHSDSTRVRIEYFNASLSFQLTATVPFTSKCVGDPAQCFAATPAVLKNVSAQWQKEHISRGCMWQLSWSDKAQIIWDYDFRMEERNTMTVIYILLLLTTLICIFTLPIIYCGRTSLNCCCYCSNLRKRRQYEDLVGS